MTDKIKSRGRIQIVQDIENWNGSAVAYVNHLLQYKEHFNNINNINLENNVSLLLLVCYEECLADRSFKTTKQLLELGADPNMLCFTRYFHPVDPWKPCFPSCKARWGGKPNHIQNFIRPSMIVHFCVFSLCVYK